MLSLRFGGHFECRLATDPDPADEPRGVSGWTFAVAGEPDLDRVIRCQPEGALNRQPGPPVGVRVEQVSLFDRTLPAHPLVGGAFDLLDEPVFEGRNGIVAANAAEPIHPVHLQVSTNDLRLRREHRDPETGEPVLTPPSVSLRPAPDLRQTAGLPTAFEHRAQRKEALERALETAVDPVQRVALRKRLDDFGRPGLNEIATASFEYWVGYEITLQGPWLDVDDSLTKLGAAVAMEAPWHVECWVGAWDADALCGYMTGHVDIPVTSATTS